MICVSLVVVVGSFPAMAAAAGAATNEGVPDLQVVSRSTIRGTTGPGQDAFIGGGGLLVIAWRAPFELWARRMSHGHIRLVQDLVRRDHRGYLPTRARAVGMADGVQRFVRVVLSGHGRHHAGFVTVCPNAGGAFALDPLGPRSSHHSPYAMECGDPLSHSMVWGIQRGWAVTPFLTLPHSANLGPGAYHARLTIDPQNLFRDADRADNTAAFTLVLHSENASGSNAEAARGASPYLPDLVPLPSEGINAHGNELDFGSTIGDYGRGDLVITGRRSSSRSRSMRAWQLLRPHVTRRAGTLVFDPHDGHNHWHYNNLARYRLVSSSGRTVAVSDKIGFCFAPTTPVDLYPGDDASKVEVNGGATIGSSPGPFTDCGVFRSLSVRMVLPAGWGDTYDQSRAGQAFDLHGVPNGRYAIEVDVNRDHRILETSYGDNVSRRTVILGGRPGERTVSVPPWNGIDTESGSVDTCLECG